MNSNVGLSAIGIGLGMGFLRLYEGRFHCLIKRMRLSLQYGWSWNEIYSSVYIIYVHYHLIAKVYLMIGLPFSFETEQMNNTVRLSAIGVGLGMDLLHLY